jgi:hypothetical protein
MSLVLCTGSREVANPDQARSLIAQRLERLPSDTTIMHGDARLGVDGWVDGIAHALGLKVERYPADWRIGKRAGIIRNERMLDLGPDLVLAFWNGSSPGTRHCITSARKRGLPTEVLRLDSQPFLLDVAEAQRRRDAAIERAYSGAGEEWKRAASWAIYTVALENRFLTGDEVWASGLPKPHEPRALGPMMKRAEKAGILRNTDENVSSAAPTRHRGAHYKWESLIYEQGKAGNHDSEPQ